MGACCCSSGGKADDSKQLEASRELDKQLKNEEQQNKRVNKLLLLGAGESGKSTLFKQMLIVYPSNPDEKWEKTVDLTEYKAIIHSNIVISMKTLCEQSIELGQRDVPVMGTQVHPKLKPNMQWVLDIKEDHCIDIPVAQNFNALWNDPGIQQTYNNRNLYQLTDSTKYYLDKIMDIGQDAWRPTKQDYLRSRVRTTGIVENNFLVDGSKFQMFDVGGQRNERKKWIHCFSGVTAVLFVAALSAYDLTLFEDDETNRMDEALNLFEEICNSRWFKKTAIILMLNKVDLFEEKIQQVPLTVYFKEYAGPERDFEAGKQYIKEQFLQRAGQTKVYANFTCATDTGLMKTVFDVTKNIIIQQSLKEGGLLPGGV